MVEVVRHLQGQAWNPLAAQILSTVSDLLAYSDPKYLSGLGQISLRDSEGLSPIERRRHQKNTQRAILGTYYARRGNSPARVELFIDNIANSTSGQLLRVRLFRYVIVGRVLFHEVGHHVSRFVIPKHGAGEELAQEWGDKLLKAFLANRYGARLHLLRAVVLPLRAIWRIARRK